MKLGTTAEDWHLVFLQPFTDSAGACYEQVNLIFTFRMLVKLAEIVILLLCEAEQYISQKATAD